MYIYTIIHHRQPPKLLCTKHMSAYIHVCTLVYVYMCIHIHIHVHMRLLTKVVFQQDQGEHIDNHTKQLSQQHQPMPGANGEGHYQQFCDNEGGEGNGHHVDKLGLKEEEAQQHDDTSLVERDEHPQEKGLEGQGATLKERRREMKEGGGREGKEGGGREMKEGGGMEGKGGGGGGREGKEGGGREMKGGREVKGRRENEREGRFHGSLHSAAEMTSHLKIGVGMKTEGQRDQERKQSECFCVYEYFCTVLYIVNLKRNTKKVFCSCTRFCFGIMTDIERKNKIDIIFAAQFCNS